MSAALSRRFEELREEHRALASIVARAHRDAARLEARGDRLGAGRLRWAVMLDQQRAKLLEIMIDAMTF